MNKEEIEIYTDTNWDDILEYNHMKWINYDRFKGLQKKAELGERYKHLYSEVKKQKDDVIEYVNSEKFGENFPYIANECQVKSAILRMLGEKNV